MTPVRSSTLRAFFSVLVLASVVALTCWCLAMLPAVALGEDISQPTLCWTATGENNGDRFGHSVASAGDVNGDGYADVIVGAPQPRSHSTGPGMAYLYLGSSSGLGATPVFSITGQHRDSKLGWSVACAGDVNGDGYDDVIIGAPEFDADPWRYTCGQVYVFYGSSAGISAVPALTITGRQRGDALGYSVASAGDVNGDGFDDVVIGAPGAPDGLAMGAFYLHLGSSAGLSASPAFWAYGQAIPDRRGWSVAGAGDVNGDGYDDVMVGAAWTNAGGYAKGQAYLYLGSSSGLSATPSFTTTGRADRDLLGSSVAGAGDVNADGFDDVLIGAPDVAVGPARKGQFYLHLGSVAGLSASPVLTVTGHGRGSADDHLGAAVAGVGDINGDGYDDALIGAPGVDVGNSYEGQSYLYLGSSLGLDATAAFTATGHAGGDSLGESLAAAGDTNGDGRLDFLVGAPNNFAGRVDKGEVYLYCGYGEPTINAPPVVDAGPDGQLDEGSLFSSSGAFSDTDSESWTAAVDYGDGTGLQVLELTDKTFTLQHIYGENGLYTVTVTVSDDKDAEGVDVAAVTVNNVAPAVGPISAPTEPVPVGAQLLASAAFTDPGLLDTHSAQWEWGDGASSTGSIAGGLGDWVVTGTHVYTMSNVYTLRLEVSDDDGGTGDSVFQYIVVYDTQGGFVTGGGWIDSPAGACRFETCTDDTAGRANFGFVSKYKKGASAPSGQTEFHFKVAELHFHSDTYEWLVVAGPQAKFKGTGTINGTGEYGFMLSAVDGQVNGGGGADKFRIKIWDRETGDIVYDNQLGALDDAQPSTVVRGGSIVIHK